MDVPSLEDTLMVLVSVKAFVDEMVEVDSFSVGVNASVEDTVPVVTFEDDSCSVVMTLYVECATVVKGKLSDIALVEVLVLLEVVVLAAFVVDLPVDWLFENEDITTAGDVKEEPSFAAVERLVPGDGIPLLLGSVAVVFDVVETPVTGFAVDVELPTEVVPVVVSLLTVVEPTLLALEFEFFTR